MKQAHTRHYKNGFQRKIKKKRERKVQLLTSLKYIGNKIVFIHV
jgi:hypothetical protein